MHNKIRATISHTSIQKPSKHKENKIHSDDEDYKRLSLLYTTQADLRPKEEKQKRIYINQHQASQYNKNLHNYLKANNFPFSFKKSSLKIPSLTTFNNIFIFLLNKIDEDVDSLEFSTEELIDVFKQIGCPVSLQKGVFNSIGVPNNWNSILGVLSWLCDFVLEKEKIQGVILEEDFQKGFSDVVMKHVFQGNQGSGKSLEFGIRDELEVKVRDVGEVKGILEREIENESFKRDELVGGFLSLKDLRNKKINLEIELENILLHINREDKLFNVSKDHILDFERKIDLKESDIGKTRGRIDELQKKIDLQGISKEESEKITKENIKIMKELENIKKEYNLKDKEIKLNSENIGKDLQEILELLQKIERQDLKEDFEKEMNDSNFNQFSDLREKIKNINKELKERVNILNNKIFESESKESTLRFNLNKKNREYWKSNTDIEEKRTILNDLRLKDISMKDKFQEDYKKYLERKKEINQENLNLQIENDFLFEEIKKSEKEKEVLFEIVKQLEEGTEFMQKSLKEETEYLLKIIFNYKLAMGGLIKHNCNIIDNGIRLLNRND